MTESSAERVRKHRALKKWAVGAVEAGFVKRNDVSIWMRGEDLILRDDAGNAVRYAPRNNVTQP